MNKGRYFLIGAFVALPFLVAACGVEAETPASGSTDERAEVTITNCAAPDAIGVVYVEGEAANGSSKRSDYIVEVSVVSPAGTQIGTGTAFATNVEPGQKALWKAITDTDAAAGEYTCSVVDVERNASL